MTERQYSAQEKTPISPTVVPVTSIPPSAAKDDVGLEARPDIVHGADFPAEPAQLSQARHPRFHKGPEVILLHLVRKLVVVLDQMGPRSHEAHLAFQYV